MKTCAHCKRILPFPSFHRDRGTLDGRQSWCIQCRAEDVNKHPERNRQKVARYRAKKGADAAHAEERHYRLKREYGITHAEYEAIYDIQDGCCAICGCWRERLVIDHDHSSGRVRDLLCPGCNLLLGYAKDDMSLLTTAIEYLRHHMSPVLTEVAV